MKSFASIAILSLFTSASCRAQVFSALEPTLELKPQILRGDEGSTVGIGYSLQRNLLQHSLNDTSAGPRLDVEASDADLTKLVLNVRGAGTLAARSERNPKNLLSIQLDAVAVHGSANNGTWIVGLLAGYETDQRGDNRQPLFGTQLTYGKMNPFGLRNHFAALNVAYARVNPVKGSDRAAAVGAGADEAYYRGFAEGLYILPTQYDVISAVEVNYRYFRERHAPAAVRQANLQQHRLGTIRLSLPKQFFLAYSRGKLPFDRKSDKIFELGWSVDVWKPK